MNATKFYRGTAVIMLLLLLTAGVAIAAPAAQIESKTYESRWLNGTYPTVKLKNAEAQRRINEAITAEVERFSLKLRSDYWLHRDQVGKIAYRLACNKADALSLILEESCERPENSYKKVWAKALTFKLSDGQQINYNDVWRIVDALGKSAKYDQAGLTDKLFEQTRRAGVALYDEFPGTPYPPEDIYLDNKLRFHVIFQPGTVSEEANGPIDIDIDEEYW